MNRDLQKWILTKTPKIPVIPADVQPSDSEDFSRITLVSLNTGRDNFSNRPLCKISNKPPIPTLRASLPPDHKYMYIHIIYP